MQDAPSILEYLNEDSAAYFEKVKAYLDEMGINYQVDPKLVRGLDYYNHTAFEIMSDADGFGAITTLSGGGRYNGLVQDLGGPETPGIGFALSIERLLMALEAENVSLPIDQQLDCYVVALGETANLKAAAITNDLRQAGIQVDKDYQGKKFKAQFKAADRLQAKFVIVLGDDELAHNQIAVKNMETGEQEAIAIDQLITHMQGIL
ncbi:histidyl-tRNA synthetase [Gracilibacillus boraciitolerans JCM 21714]|uniref:histidine--tRNA ligase n=1 Tax=Gracilibacillus boraciitolerans JCM 21714 TaxID=1298598 RepID=W4VLU3_9BACI|nr:histidyl-tRNA synthetase [Gracilibacillus boraciitolerans JCM 21714]